MDGEELSVQTYPLRCAFRDWLCCDEFLDSAKGKKKEEHVSETARVLKPMRRCAGRIQYVLAIVNVCFRAGGSVVRRR
jgi:hypothetical protein